MNNIGQHAFDLIVQHLQPRDFAALAAASGAVAAQLRAAQFNAIECDVTSTRILLSLYLWLQKHKNVRSLRLSCIKAAANRKLETALRRLLDIIPSTQIKTLIVEGLHPPQPDSFDRPTPALVACKYHFWQLTCISLRCACTACACHTAICTHDK